MHETEKIVYENLQWYNKFLYSALFTLLIIIQIHQRYWYSFTQQAQAEREYDRSLSRDLLTEKFLESLAILCEFLDALMEFIESHLILEESPSELWLVIDVGNPVQRLTLSGYWRGGVSEDEKEHRLPN